MEDKKAKEGEFERALMSVRARSAKRKFPEAPGLLGIANTPGAQEPTHTSDSIKEEKKRKKGLQDDE